MKYILLLRHAKSSWSDENLKDFDRPLNERGERDAPLMGKFIRDIEYLPDKIISSPAKRAKETTIHYLQGAGQDETIVDWNDQLYYGTGEDYLESIQLVDDYIDCIMLVGHNPLIEDTVSELCGSQGDVAVRMPTAACACIEHPAERWEMVLSGTARLKWLMIPKVVKHFKL